MKSANYYREMAKKDQAIEKEKMANERVKKINRYLFYIEMKFKKTPGKNPARVYICRADKKYIKSIQNALIDLGYTAEVKGFFKRYIKAAY